MVLPLPTSPEPGFPIFSVTPPISGVPESAGHQPSQANTLVIRSGSRPGIPVERQDLGLSYARGSAGAHNGQRLRLICPLCASSDLGRFLASRKCGWSSIHLTRLKITSNSRFFEQGKFILYLLPPPALCYRVSLTSGLLSLTQISISDQSFEAISTSLSRP